VYYVVSLICIHLSDLSVLFCTSDDLFFISYAMDVILYVISYSLECWIYGLSVCTWVACS